MRYMFVFVLFLILCFCCGEIGALPRSY